MLLKFITKFIRPLGLFLIFLFAAFCILGSGFVDEFDENTYLGKYLGFTTSFENRFYDYRALGQLKNNKLSQHISLVKIDDESLQKIGMWPIPRNIQAKMIDKLREFGAKVVAMDIMYPEQSQSCGNFSPDAELAAAFKRFNQDDRKIYLAYTLTESESQRAFNECPPELFDDVITNIPTNHYLKTYKVDKYTYPIQEILNAQPGLGYIGMEEDRDGIFRRYHLITNVEDTNFGSLGLNTWRGFTQKNATLTVFENRQASIELDSSKVQLNHRGELKIRYFGNIGAFPNIGLADLLTAKNNDELIRKKIKDKIVFIGSTAVGAHDLRPSPIDSKMPGVLAHMNLVQMILDKNFFRPINDSVEVSLIFLSVGMLIFLIVQHFKNAFLDLIALITLIGALSYIDQYYFLPHGYELSLFYCFFCFLGCYSWNTFLEFWETSKEKKHIKGTFARYVAPTVVDEMLQDPSKLVVGGARKDITCLFSDVRDFTSISEGLSATELAQSLNMYMGKMTDIVFETKGTLDKYIGDAIVAFWGAPLQIGNHAEYAVIASLKMMEILPSINEEFTKLGRPQFKVGVGINTGECNVGNMGSSRIFSYTALGDNMNLGSRLEGLCKYYGTQILISENTLNRLDQSKFNIRPIDRVIVKGRTTPVAIFEVLSNVHPFMKMPETLASYKAGVKLFEQKNFKAAKEIFDLILTTIPDDAPTERFSKLCDRYIKNPEMVDDYFDVTKMTEK